jgi:hypothetical protein
MLPARPGHGDLGPLGGHAVGRVIAGGPERGDLNVLEELIHVRTPADGIADGRLCGRIQGCVRARAFQRIQSNPTEPMAWGEEEGETCALPPARCARADPTRLGIVGAEPINVIHILPGHGVESSQVCAVEFKHFTIVSDRSTAILPFAGSCEREGEVCQTKRAG